ncbi:MAG: histidine phosphatase family protein [Patescibacteria group bacterium]|nr:histidine phosphatase family protein [Patescibacteria group bacterium]
MHHPAERPTMKWPASVTLVRHAESEYNAEKKTLRQERLYRAFSKAYDRNPLSFQTFVLAKLVDLRHPARRADFSTSLALGAGEKAQKMASVLKTQIPIPDVVFVSPLTRTQQTFEWMLKGWPELKQAIEEGKVKVVREPRIREQEFGEANGYVNSKVYYGLNRRQARIRKNMGDLAEYWYRIPGGESENDVQQREQLWIGALTRDYSGQNVLAITHHLSILGFRAAVERLDDREYVRLDKEDKPINLGVTVYEGDPTLGSSGRLVRRRYNDDLLSPRRK